LLDGRSIEPTGNLLSDPDGEAVAGGLKQPTPLDFVLERLAFGLGGLQGGVGMAERIGCGAPCEGGCRRRIASSPKVSRSSLFDHLVGGRKQ